MLKRYEREKNEKKTHTQLPGFELAFLCQLLASRAGNYLTKQLSKETKYKICFHLSVNIMSRARNLPSEKKNTSHMVANTNIGKRKL